MVNEYVYCPRLAYLEWVQGEWEDNRETLEGKRVHRRVDRRAHRGPALHRRSLPLTSERLGLTAVIDLLEGDGRRVRPVDYKRGKVPDVPGGAWEPERVQLCAQGLLLREHGFVCNEGLLYFAGSKRKVRVRFSKQLVARTESLLGEMRDRFARGPAPAPLEDSPKCPRCSLVRICLPEEVHFLRRSKAGDLRPIAVSDAGTHALVLQEPGARLRLRGGGLLVEQRGEPPVRRGFDEISHVVLMGGSSCSTPVLRECCQRGVPVVHMSGTGWFYGITQGMPHKNIELRIAQFEAAADAERSLPLARRLVAAKIENCRVLLRRNGSASRHELARLKRYAADAEAAPDVGVLLGLEGTAARLYFERFTTLFKGPAAEETAFDLEARNRRPPKDPVNALLSLAYSLLTKDFAVACHTVGLDPLLGFFHRPRYGKPALALDLMEPFRPVIADSVVVSVLNNGEIGAADFVERAGGVLLRPEARRRLIGAYERRLSTEVRHPVFGYRASYRRVFEIEARLVARWLQGDVPAYPGFVVR